MADSTGTPAAPKPTSSVKLVLLGEAAVGKVRDSKQYVRGVQTANGIKRQSSLVLRFVNNDFQENKEPTIGGESQPLQNPSHHTPSSTHCILFPKKLTTNPTSQRHS